MPTIGTGTVDIRNVISNIINVIKTRANTICTAPCDGLVLKMHYRWTFFVLIGGFFTVWYQWYHRDVITCVSHFNAETQVRLDYINICLSYPYVEVHEDGGKSRRYLMFYRWVQWSFLVMAAIYYIPRKISKHMENPKCKKLIEELAANACRYDNTENILVEKVTMYMACNLRTHNGLYWKYVSLNIISLAIDIMAMHYFDFLLQGRFIRYGFDAFPFDRDPEKFSDYMSQMFPPFAVCTIDTDNQLVGQRTEKFGCHLTIMELYEKIFLGLWIWLIVLMIIEVFYIICLMLAVIPKLREFWLRTSKPQNATENANILISKVNKNLRIGDVYLLYRFKNHLTHAKFYELLTRLADPRVNLRNKVADQTQLDTKPQLCVKINSQMNHHNQNHSAPLQHQQHPDARNRKQPQPQPPLNPDYISQLYASPDTLAKHGQISQNDLAQRTPLLNKNNTSILIE